VEEDFKALLHENLLAFSMKAFKAMNSKNMPNDPYLKLLADRLARVAVRKTKRLIVNLPPRHYKTWIGSVCLSAWILGREPSAKILIVTYGQELADRIAHSIRTMMRTDWYKALFEDTKLTKGHSKLVDFATTAGGSVRSVSIEGGVTGHGADYIIIDDPIEIKDCDNAKRLERVAELFDNEILTRLNSPKRGCIVVIAHRVNEDDLSGHLLQQGGWKRLKLPLIATRTHTYELDDGRVWQRRKGELLMPHAFGQRDIERLQAARRPGFATLQQQDPGGTRLRIKAEHFPTFPLAAVPMSESGVVLSIDPGQKGGAAHSYSVIQAWLNVRDRHFLLRQWREQATYPDLRSAVHKMIARYNPSVVLIEDTNQGPALLCEIRPRAGMMVHPVTPTGDKIERVRRHLATIRKGCIQIPWDAEWRESFVAELTLFPGAGYDDQVDATVQYLDWIAKNPTPPKRERPASAAVADSTGHIVLASPIVPDIQTRGGVMIRGRRRW
jgi:predicted phage terminase large subunit-like protein